MNSALILLCSAAAALSSIGIRVFQTRIQKNDLQLQLFQFGYILVDALIFLIMSGFSLPTARNAWLLAIAFAFCMLFATIGLAESYQCGPMSLSSIIINCNVLMPILAGCIAYKETLRPVHILGILFLMATLVLSGIGPKTEKRDIAPIWYLYVLMAFLGNGFGAIILSAYGKQFQGAGNQSFLGAAFFLSALLLLAFYFYSGTRHAEKSSPIRPFSLFLLLIGLSAGGCFAVNILLLHLSGVMPASLLYPLYTGASTLLICLVSCIIFKEKLTRKKVINILLGLTAVILLNL